MATTQPRRPRPTPEIISPVNRRNVLTAVVLGIGVSAVIWLFGADVLHSLLIGGAATVIGVAAMYVSGDRDLEGLDLSWQYDDRNSRGSRDDITTLSWSLRSGWGRVGRTAEIKLRQIALRRLEMIGLNLEDPADRAAIERQIGAPVYKILTRTKINGLALTTIIACLDTLDALDPNHYPQPGQRPVRRGFFDFLTSRRKGNL